MEKILEFIKNNIQLEFDKNKMPYIKLSRHDYCKLIKMLESYSKEED